MTVEEENKQTAAEELNEKSSVDERLEEIKRQSLAELENMERIISENEKIKAEITDKAEQQVKESSEIKKGGKTATLVFIVILVAICTLSLVSIYVLKPMGEYNKASGLLREGRYDEAATQFERLGDYKDASSMVMECSYQKAKSLMAEGKNGLALAQLRQITDYKDSADIINSFIGSGDGIIAVGDRHSAAVNSIGRVLSCGDNSFGQCVTGDWNGITAVAAGSNHTLGLCEDGSVVATGSNGYGQCDVEDWHNIVYIAAAGNTSYGIRADGSVVATGDNARGQCDVENDKFTKVKKIVCGGEYAAALKEDGSVVLAGNTAKVAQAESWTDVKDLSALGFTLCALKNNGTADVCGDMNGDVSGWSDIKYAAAGYCYAVGIKSNGEVISTTELNENIAGVFKNSVRIQCGMGHILALKSDGTLAAIGQNKNDECSVADWRDIMLK